MLTLEQKEQFSAILEELGSTLDISETQYNAAVASYQAVGNHLSKEDSLLARYKPEILPQGSFMIGTVIKPINEEDDLDIDLVCQLTGKNPSWTQEDLKLNVGDQLESNATYKDMLEEKRRCWRLQYRKDSENLKERYHMDILPSIVDSDYRIVLERAFASSDIDNVDSLALRITDNEVDGYYIQTDHLEWMKSNPFGYGKWFLNRATIDATKTRLLMESVQPVPTYSKEKLPLQRVVQILKRHRDMMWKDRTDIDDKPISIIITTLAAAAYNKEQNILDALYNVLHAMPNHIKDWYSPEHGKVIKKVANPVNEEENFADKWVEFPQRQRNFYAWLEQARKDLENILSQKGRGLQSIGESMQGPFGKSAVTRTLSSYGEKYLQQRESGKLQMAAGTGMLGNTGRTTVPQHKPYGKRE